MTAALFLLGLLLRVSMLGLRGMRDVDSYRAWGMHVLSNGLADGFTGTYYPVQFQFFATAAWLGGLGGRDAFFWLKVLNLFGDLGIYLLLMLSVDHARRNRVTWLYWLNPWFVALSGLGYCDFQFSFFLLLFCVLLRRASGAKGAVWAGVPLAIAFLMKPQVMVVVLALGILVAVSLARRRPAWDALATLIAPVLLFSSYSLFFFAHGKPLFYLARNYLGAANVMPSVTAHMMNIWYPIATMAKPASPDWQLRDDATLLGLHMRWIGLGLMFASLTWFAFLIIRRTDESQPRRLLPIVVFGSVVLPMVVTGAHENHLFFGTLGLCLLLAVEPAVPRWLWAAVLAMMGVQTLNVLGLYGLGRNALSSTAPLSALAAFWEGSLPRTAAALLDIAAFLAVITFLTKLVAPAIRRAYLPACMLGSVFALLCVATLGKRDQLAASPDVRPEPPVVSHPHHRAARARH